MPSKLAGLEYVNALPAEVVGGPLNLYVVLSVNPCPGEKTFIIPELAA